MTRVGCVTRGFVTRGVTRECDQGCTPPHYSQQVGSMHPTGMSSC